jgi:hypothetical protein
MGQMKSIPLPSISKGLNTSEESGLTKPNECINVEGFKMFEGVWRKDFKLEEKSLVLSGAYTPTKDNVSGCLESETISYGLFTIDSASDIGSGSGTFSTGNAYVSYTGNPNRGFLRFINITVPKDATILKCILHFTGSRFFSVAYLPVIYFENSDNAIAPTTVGELLGLSLTTENVAWEVALVNVYPVWNESPELKGILQVIVNKPGWVSGNAVQIVIDGNYGTYSAWAYIYYLLASGLVPVLEIVYTTA